MACHKPCQPIFQNPRQRNIQVGLEMHSHKSSIRQPLEIHKNRWHSTYIRPLGLEALSFSGQSHWVQRNPQNASSDPTPLQSPSCVTKSTAKDCLSKSAGLLDFTAPWQSSVTQDSLCWHAVAVLLDQENVWKSPSSPKQPRASSFVPVLPACWQQALVWKVSPSKRHSSHKEGKSTGSRRKKKQNKKPRRKKIIKHLKSLFCPHYMGWLPKLNFYKLEPKSEWEI